jgi:hypothetical protein
VHTAKIGLHRQKGLSRRIWVQKKSPETEKLGKVDQTITCNPIKQPLLTPPGESPARKKYTFH